MDGYTAKVWPESPVVIRQQMIEKLRRVLPDVFVNRRRENHQIQKTTNEKKKKKPRLIVCKQNDDYLLD